MPHKRPRRPLAPFRLTPLLRLQRMSKRKLALKAGVAYPMVCRLAKGKANPTWSTVLRLAKALGCSPADFERRKKA